MSTAIERLQSGHYNSAGVSGANPGGLGNGGHVENFPSALQDIGDVAQGVGGQAAQAVGAAGSAGASAAAAAADRQLAQQAAAAAAAVDPTTKVSKAGDTMTGPLKVGASARVELAPGGGVYTGILNFFRADGQRLAYLLGDQTTLYFAKDAGQNFAFQGPLSVEGSPVFTAGNDGSGSGLDADMVRGLAPHQQPFSNTLVVRDSTGVGQLVALSLWGGGDARKGIYFPGIGGWFFQDGAGFRVDRDLYADGGVSAATVTERSDRSLKEDIVDLEPVVGRLRPVRYRLKETGEDRIGFIAQEVAEVQPLAVSQPEGGLKEVRLTALIAQLAQHLNSALDRIEALEQAK